MITFVDYRFKGIGGVEQLVVNITIEINRRGHQTKIYCSKESYIYKRLVSLKAKFVHIDSEQVSLNDISKYLTLDDIIILTHINDTPLLEKIKRLNNRIVFYSVHTNTFFAYPKILNWICWQNKAALRLVDILHENNALYFMDGPNLKPLTDKGWSCKEVNWLPVPIQIFNGEIKKFPDAGVLKVTYLGRSGWNLKIFPVIKILEDLNQMKQECELHILTDSKEPFERLISEFITNNKVKIKYIINLFGEELEKYLIDNSHIHIAMGLSALEGSKLGIPTILIDHSEKKFPSYYKYRWLFECEDYCLGSEIVNGILPYSTGTSLKEKIEEIKCKNGWEKIADECRHYTYKNHSITSFVDVLTKATASTNMTVRKYCDTSFSKNQKRFQPILLKLSKIKNLLLSSMR